MLFRVLRAVRHYPYLFSTIGVLAAVAGTLAARVDRLGQVGQAAAATGAGIVVLSTAWWIIRWLLPEVSTGRWVGRRDDASEHAGGVATWLDVGERAGKSATRRKAATLRSSIAALPWWKRRYVVMAEYAVPLLRTGWVPVGNTVWSTCEDVTMRFGGPRTGKTASLACHALDAPGSLVVTTSRTDLLDLTSPARRKRGRVDVFNPTALGVLESTVRWSPLIGCDDYATAQRRATDLVPLSTGEAERWDNQARGLLAVLMHASALADGSMRTVLGWVSPADVIARDQILTALAESPMGRELGTLVRSLFGTNDRTLTSITTTLLPAIRWLTETTAAQVGDADLDDPDFLNVQQLVAGGTDSLYLIGREGACRSLIGALTAEVAHQVRMTAASLPYGRLDPPMTAILDEAPLTCGPVPLHDWTSDMGGRGLTLHIAAQSPAQLRDTWGDDRAATILGNTHSLLVFGGLKAADDLERISTLCGNRLLDMDPDDRRPYPVMTAAEIGSLPPRTALLVTNGLRPLIGRPPMVWDRQRPLYAGYQRFRTWIDTYPERRLARRVAALQRRLAAQNVAPEPAPGPVLRVVPDPGDVDSDRGGA
jgi:type IV secretion system protein VirD4